MTSYEIITDQIIKKMNEGTIPWVKPWHTAGGGWECEGMNQLFPAYSYSNACFLSHTAGLSSESSFRNSVGYLQGWLKALKDDPKMIVQASAQAEKAAEYILNA